MSRHLLLLTDIARLIGEAKSLQEVLDSVVRLVADRMRADVCSIWLLDGERQRLNLAATCGLSPEAVGRSTLKRGEGMTWLVLERFAPVMVEDAFRDPRFVYLPETREERFPSFLAVPLQVRGAALGVLSVQSREVRRYTPDEVRSLAAISSQIAPVVDNARLLTLLAHEGAAAAPRERASGPRRVVGTPCSAGVVHGTILRLMSGTRPGRAARGGAAEESAKLEEAMRRSRAELLRMQEWLRERNAEEAALVFSVQLMFLEDASFAGRMRTAVAEGAGAAEAIERSTADILARFAGLKDLFFRERAADVEDLAARLLRNAEEPEDPGAAALKGRIAVLPVLAPSRLVSLCAEGVAAVLAGGGGPTSHAALLARSLDLPLVVGLDDILGELKDGQGALVDASSGEVVLDPPAALVAELGRAAAASEDLLGRLSSLPAPASPGRLRLEANVNLWGDVVRAAHHGADGIGLYRSEFAFLLRPDLPSEEEQYVLYRRIVEQVAPRPVTFRLLDAGGDKLVPALGQTEEPNPFLGYRSLRLLLDHPEILGPQVRAILHSVEETQGRILVPMVTDAVEFRAVKDEIRKERNTLPPLGAMIELPSALFDLDRIAQEADFLSVGTNDLTQHLLGVDRTNARVTKWYDPCHPAVLRAIDAVVRAARTAGKPVGICGGMASNPLFLPLWIAFDIERLAAHAFRIPLLRALEPRIDPAEARRALPRLLSEEQPSAVRLGLERLAPPELQPLLHGRRGF